MEFFHLFLIKLLKRLKSLKYFNFYVKKNLNGTKIRIPFINNIGLSNYILKPNWLDSLIQNFVRDENSVFIDVGANIGQTLLRFKTIKPNNKYLGFEPNATCISYLYKLIAINDFQDCNVYNCALYSSLQFLFLEMNTADDLSASILSSLRPRYFSDKEQIIAIDYDQLNINYETCLIKIDVEGCELEVIKGMRSFIEKHQPIIICEVLDYHDNSVAEISQARALELSNLLLSLKYSIIQFKTSYINQNFVSYKKIDTITLIKWDRESMNLNDYIFFSSYREIEVLDVLLRSCK